MVLPEGFALPPFEYLLAILLGVLLVGGALLRDDPPVTGRTVIGLVPWMAAGGAFHVLYVAELAPPVIRPLFGTGAVYGLTAIAAGVVWLLGRRASDETGVPAILAATGGIALLAATALIVAAGIQRGTIAPFWSAIAVVVTVGLTAIVWPGLRRVMPATAETTGSVGVAVVFAHLLDGISTSVGVDIIGVGERSPLPRLLMETAATLPTAPYLGTGWLFVLVKFALSVGVLWLFAPFVRESPRQAYLLLAAIAAVGLGPGVHNLLLFALAG